MAIPSPPSNYDRITTLLDKVRAGDEKLVATPTFMNIDNRCASNNTNMVKLAQRVIKNYTLWNNTICQYLVSAQPLVNPATSSRLKSVSTSPPLNPPMSHVSNMLPDTELPMVMRL